MCTYVLRSVSRASITLLSNSHCRTLPHSGRPQPAGPATSFVVASPSRCGSRGVPWSAQPDQRPPVRTGSAEASPPFTRSPRGLREEGAVASAWFSKAIILAPRLGFPTGFLSSPIHSVLPHHFLPFQGQGECSGAWCAPVCCGHPTGRTGEEINTLL